MLKPKGKIKHPPCPSLSSLNDNQPTDNRAEFQLMLMATYGDIVRLPGIFKHYAISHPDYIQQVLHTNYKNYLKTDINFYKGLTKVIGRGLLSNHDLDLWSKERRLIQPNFHTQNFPHFATLTTTCTENFAKHWFDFEKQNKPFDIFDEMLKLALEITLKTLFSSDITHFEHVIRFTKLANHFMANGLFLAPWLPSPKNLQFLFAKKQLNNAITQLINERRTKTPLHENDDLLSRLLLAQQHPENQHLTDQLLHDEVKTFLITGHESTGVALAWTWYCLSQHNEVWQKLQHELSTVLNGRTPTYHDLPSLTYTRLVFEEALRLYPPVWLTTRKSVAADQLGEFHVPAKATILISPYVMHRHPAYWVNPDIFDPERHRPENSHDRSKYAYIPFGTGPRICIGSSFVMMEAVLILATLAQRFKLELVEKQQIKLKPQITLRTKRGIWMKAVGL